MISTLSSPKAQSHFDTSEADGGKAEDERPEAGPSRGKIRRPRNGEIEIFLNGIDLRENAREPVYDWTETGGEPIEKLS